jgi:hypothetical protein
MSSVTEIITHLTENIHYVDSEYLILIFYILKFTNKRRLPLELQDLYVIAQVELMKRDIDIHNY